MKEVWKLIPGYTRYEVSSLGRVRHIKFRRIRSARLRSDGYTQVNIWRDSDGRKRTIKVHRLVAIAFLPNSEDAIIDHKNRVRDDNRLENLKVSTYSLNSTNKSLPLKPTIVRIIRLHTAGLPLDDIAEALVA